MKNTEKVVEKHFGRETLSKLIIIAFIGGMLAKLGLSPSQSILTQFLPFLQGIDPKLPILLSLLASALSISSPILAILGGAAVHGIVGAVAVVLAFAAGYLLPSWNGILALCASAFFTFLTPSERS